MRTFVRIILLLAVSTLASADSGVSFPTPTAAAAGTYAHDLYAGLFGAWADAPWSTIGSASTLLGQIFLGLNTFIFALAVCWSSFSLTVAAVQTAQHGEVFGKRFDTMWMPVRMTVGMGMLVPALGGYSFAQAIMMSCTLMGSSLADTAYSAVINAISSGTTLIAPASGVSNMSAGKGSDALVEQMFVSSACVHFVNAMMARAGTPPNYSRSAMTANDGSESIIIYGTRTPDWLGNLSVQCGKVTITKKGSTAHTTSNAVNYDAISSQVYQSTVATVQSFSTQVDAVAKQWVDAETGNGSFEPERMVAWTSIPDLQPLKAQFVAQLATTRQQAFTSGLPAITLDAQSNMRKGGWMAAGAWYGTIAMETDAIREASDAIFGYTQPTITNATFAENLAGAIARTHDSTSRGVGGTTGKSAEAGLLCKVFGSPINATGNCSFGQAAVGYLVNFTSASGGGVLGTGSVATINPILSMKTMGDYLMGVGDAFQGIGFGLKAYDWLSGWSGKVAKKAIKSVSKEDGEADDGGLLGNIANRLSTLAMPLILLGLLMSIYIPMIPLLTWVGGLLSYATVFVEAIVAAPLWAMAHLDPVGEGMGNRTQHGYLFLVNVLLRPALMLVGWVAASALIIILGSIVYAMYLPAVASMQGDSLTGVYSVLALLALFWILNFTIIQGAMNLIYLVPDQVLNWIGHAGQTQLGKEVENKVYGAMFSVAASMRGMITGAAGVGQAGKAAQTEERRHRELIGALSKQKR